MDINDRFILANTLAKGRKFQEADDIYSELLEYTSEKHKIWLNKALNFKRMADYHQALESVNNALKTSSTYVSAYIAKFEILALMSEYESAMKYQEWMFGDNFLSHPSLEDSVAKRLDWDDPYVQRSLYSRNNIDFSQIEDSEDENLYDNILSKVDGKTIVILSSQGLGDVIQCSQYITYLYEYYNPKKIILVGRKELYRVMYNLCPVFEFSTIMPKEYDYFVPIFSLMKLFGGDNTPAFPWLKVSERDVNFYSYLINSDGRTKVGIVWKGNPNHTNDGNRSSTIQEIIARMGDVSDKHIISLQYDPSEEEKEYMRNSNIRDMSKHINDLFDIGCIMKSLDLFISVDSAPIHLAGALGINSLLLLPLGEEDWRWGTSEKANYESVKIIRKSKAP